MRAELARDERGARAYLSLPAGVSEYLLDLEFTTGFSLSGTVSRNGEPVSGASLYLTGPRSYSGRTLSDHTGAFGMTGLGAGSYRLTLFDFRADFQHTRAIEVAGDRKVTIELATGLVAGRLLDGHDFSPIAAATLSLEPLNGHWPGRDLRAESDSQGRFLLDQVPEGRFRLVAAKGGYSPAETVVEIQANSPIEGLQLTLPRDR